MPRALSASLSASAALLASAALVVVVAHAQAPRPDPTDGLTDLRAAVPAGGETRLPPEPATVATRLDAKRKAASPSAANAAASAGTTGFVSQPPRPPSGPVAPITPRTAGKAGRTAERQNERANDAAITATAGRADRQAEAQRQRVNAEPVEASDPFDPVGLRLGSFVLRPAAEVAIGYESNPLRTATNRKASSFQRYLAELALRSDWSRHALTGDLKGTFTQFNDLGGNDRPELDARLRGRLDVTDFTRIEAEARHLLSTESPGSPDAPTGAVRPALVNTTSGALGAAHRWNRLEIGLRGTVERAVYENATLRNGGVDSNSDRTRTESGLALRASYEVSPGVRPFVEGRADARVFDRRVDSGGFARGSTGQQFRAGTTFELTRLLTGEVAAGWLVRHYDDARLPTASGLLVDASLVWAASGLTNVRFTAATTIDETTLAGTTAVVKRDAAVTVEHAFRRWLIGTLGVGIGRDDYGLANRVDDRFSASATLTSKLSRELWLKAELRHDRLDSSVPGADYTANILLVGLRLQR